MNIYEGLNYWGSVYASIACVVFTILYSVISPWWKTPTGRLIMMLIGGLTGLAALSILFRAYQNLDAIRMIRFVLISIVGTAVWGHVISLVTAQRRGRRTDGPEREEHDTEQGTGRE